MSLAAELSKQKSVEKKERNENAIERNGKKNDRVPIFVCKLREKREELGLSRQDVASATGTSPITIGIVELGHNVTLKIAFRICSFFDLDVREIWPGFLEAVSKNGKPHDDHDDDSETLESEEAPPKKKKKKK